MIQLNLSVPILSKKNSRPIYRNRYTGKPFLGKSRKFQDFEQIVMIELLNQKNKWGLTTIDYPVNCQCKIYVNDKRIRDLINLEESIADLLQSARIIKNDSLIYSWNGSEIIHKKSVGAIITIEDVEEYQLKYPFLYSI